MITFDRSAERAEMVAQQIAARGVRDPRVLHALRTVPRERFLSPEYAAAAYDDRALSVGYGQTISQPFIVAFMTEALEINKSHRVLEVGTGTGYQTVILAMLAAHVYSIERLEELSIAAHERAAICGLTNASFRIGDGGLGWPEDAPFDRIMVTAAAPGVPAALVDQLAVGGMLILPVGEEGSQQLLRVERRENRVVERPLLSVRFVPLLGAAGFPG